MSTLTIVPDDKVISVDGVSVVCDFEIDSDIHAVQWNGTTGHVEWKPFAGKEQLKLSNIGDYQSYIDLHGVKKAEQEQSRQDAETAALAPLYQRNRLSEYGSIGDQLDMIYWDGKNGTNLWQEHIYTIKSKYPKE